MHTKKPSSQTVFVCGKCESDMILRDSIHGHTTRCLDCGFIGMMKKCKVTRDKDTHICYYEVEDHVIEVAEKVNDRGYYRGDFYEQ